MKKIFVLMLLICFSFLSCKTKSNIEQQNSFDFYFARSKNTWDEQEKYGKWVLKNDPATITLGYFRGDCCGSVPNPKLMKAKISNDTLYFDFKNIKRSDCDSKTKICGAVIDFVINKKKYPNYKKYPRKFASLD